MLKSGVSYVVLSEKLENEEVVETKAVYINSYSLEINTVDDIQRATWFSEEELEDLKVLVSSRNRFFKRKGLGSRFTIKKQIIAISDVED